MPAEPRFLCDEMLGRLARWLRAAGFDTAQARPGARDAALLHQAWREDRLLLTRDRKIAEHRSAHGRLLVLYAPDLAGTAIELKTRLNLNWLFAPFSRCLVCNTPLEPEAEAMDQVPPTARAGLAAASLRRCPHCHRLYWPGGHVARMQERLAGFARHS